MQGCAIRAPVSIQISSRRTSSGNLLLLRAPRETGRYSGAPSPPLAYLTTTPNALAPPVTHTSAIAPVLRNQVRFKFTRFSYNGVESSPHTNFGIPLIEIESLPLDRIRFGP